MKERTPRQREKMKRKRREKKLREEAERKYRQIQEWKTAGELRREKRIR